MDDESDLGRGTSSDRGPASKMQTLPSRLEISISYSYLCPRKFSMDTKNEWLGKRDFLSNMAILGIYVKFLGVSCFLGSKSVFGVHFQVPSQFLRVVMLMGQGSLVRSIWNEWLVAIFGNASTPLLDLKKLPDFSPPNIGGFPSSKVP